MNYYYSRIYSFLINGHEEKCNREFVKLCAKN